MAQSSHLLDLANRIQAQVAEIQQDLATSGQSDPQFDGQTEAVDFTAVDDTRSAVLDNLTELHDLLCTPREMLLSRSFPTEPASRHAMNRFGILKAVPLDGTATYDELAEKTGLPATTLRRLVRHAMTVRIFHEPKPEHVSHTHASRLLAENSHVRDLFGTVDNEAWPAATRICDALARWPAPDAKDECGFFLATGQTFYDALASDRVRQARHDNSYAAFAGDRAFSLQHIIDNFDWAALGSAKVVDVGGGVGTLSKALAAAFPSLHFIVQDKPDVLAARDPVEHSRIEFMPHDFFTPQPIRDGSAYVFRRVLMDWPDEKVVQILRNLTPAMKRGTTVLVIDSQIPTPGTCPLWLERRFRSFDLLGLALGAKGAREIGSWKGLFAEASPDYEVKSVQAVRETEIAIIEAIWKGENS